MHDVKDDPAKCVAILVTAYNPVVEELFHNIASYSEQVSLIVIFDNSDRPETCADIRKSAFAYKNITVIGDGVNHGIATAQNLATDYAIEQGYEFFLEMDQDSRLPLEYVSKVFLSYQKLSQAGHLLGGLGPVAVRESDNFVYGGFPDNGLHRVEYTLSSGFLFSLDAWKKVGRKDDSLFIDFVDWDWCWRCGKKNLEIFVDAKLKISHILGDGYRKIAGFDVGVPSPVRHYYQYRNSLFLLRKSYVPMGWKLKRILINSLKLPIYCFMLRDGPTRRGYILRGIIDFFKGRVGPIPLVK